jgi:hypothetical protein
MRSVPSSPIPPTSTERRSSTAPSFATPAPASPQPSISWTSRNRLPRSADGQSWQHPGSPTRSCPSTSPSAPPTNTAQWPRPRSSAWRSSTKRPALYEQNDDDINIIDPKAHGLGYFYSPLINEKRRAIGLLKLGIGCCAMHSVFRFALLEHRSVRVSDEHILKREEFWKRLLLTRGGLGMNRN